MLLTLFLILCKHIGTSMTQVYKYAMTLTQKFFSCDLFSRKKLDLFPFVLFNKMFDAVITKILMLIYSLTY